MADFTQVRFLGASICQFNASLGWSNQTSQLSVRLVEDDVAGDSFAPVGIGSPVNFNYQGWVFNGLLQSWRRIDNSGGSPTYDVTVVDPREILEGVQLIIADYPGPVNGVFNVLNIYGYYEDQGFGNSDVNEAGMSWYFIQQAVQTITNVGYSSSFGTSIRFNTSSYTIDLSAMPQLPYYYRVGGTSVSLMDFIIDICEAAGCDFFFTMAETAIHSFVIYLNVVNRRVLPQLGQIANFISNQQNVTSADVGYELLNNNTGKFVVGGALEQINLQFIELDRVSFSEAEQEELVKFNQTILERDGFDEEENDSFHYYDGNIWPFWGFNADGNAILGQGQPYSNGHYMTLDSRSIEVGGVGAFYTSDVGEMRSAMDSFESWMLYLQTKDDDAESPAFQRYTLLKGISPLNNNILSLLNGAATPAAIAAIPWAHMAAVTGRQRKLAAGSLGSDELEEMMRLYDFVRMYASEFYGKKFMVRVPFIYTKVESETLKQTLSQDPVNEGFISEDEWADAVALNFLPFDINRLTTEEGKIEAYVRYDNTNYLDISGLGGDDFIFSENNQSVFIKCRVDPTLVYLDLETYYSPRAIIELAGPVRILKRFGDETGFSGQIVDALNLLFSQKFPAVVGQAKDTALKAIMDAWQAQGASESLFIGKIGKALPPILVALPLRSNIESYGPWYVQGAAGKMDFEKDDSLVPWNYGGYEVMNLVADSKIVEALTNQVVQEAGKIEFPGVPAVQLGSALIADGPFVTDINVSIGSDGATTTYTMQLAPRFGKFAKANVDRLTRIAKTSQRGRRLFRELNRELPSNHQYFKTRQGYNIPRGAKIPNQVKNHSSHLLLQGECLPKDDGTFHINVLTQPTYNFLNQSYTEYERKGIVSLDALFVPFSTDTSATDIPCFDELPVTSSGITRDSINPYSGSHGISQVGRDTVDIVGDDATLYEDDGYSDDEIYRGIAFRGPVMIAGWGYDTNDQPTSLAEAGDPNNPDGSGIDFPSNIRQRPDLWKVGPLDTRWDDDKKLWSASGGSGGSGSGSIFRAIALNTIIPYGSGSCRLMSTGATVPATSWLGQPVCSGQKVYLFKETGSYYLNVSEFSSLNIITDVVCTSGVNTTTRNTIYFPSAYVRVSG